MVIGDPARFALRYSDKATDDFWALGHLCFIAAGHELGDYDRGASLNAAVAAIKDQLRYAGRRGEPTLYELAAEDVFSVIDAELYGEGGPRRGCAAVSDPWRFDAAHMGLDVFDQWKIYVVEGAADARLVWKQRVGTAYTAVREVRLSPGEFDAVLGRAVASIEAAYPRIVVVAP
jgi:hypothetical protein